MWPTRPIAARWVERQALHCLRISALVAAAAVGSSAWAQSAPAAPVLKGGVQQTDPSTPPIGTDNGSTTPNAPGAYSAACKTVDPECGGTNRQCYDALYHSTAIVMSVQQSQKLYAQTQGRIWYSCGECRNNVICWPRPGFEDLIAGKGGTSGSNPPGGASGGGAGAPRSTLPPMPSPMDDTMSATVASCAMVKRQQGSLNGRPGCTSQSVEDWCEKQKGKNPNCIAIIADSGVRLPTATDGGPGGASTPTGNTHSSPIPFPTPVLSSPKGQGSSGGGNPGIPGWGAPLQGKVDQKGPPPPPASLKTTIFTDSTGKKVNCKYDPANPYYNSQAIPGYGSQMGGFASQGGGIFTVDLEHNSVVNLNRSFPNLGQPGAAAIKGNIVVECDKTTGLITSMTLNVGPRSYPLTASPYNLAAGY